MQSICRRTGVVFQVLALWLLLAPETFAAGEHLSVAPTTCAPLPGRQVGNAMFYGPGFDGRIMANGQVFHMNALTASSRTLPLGTRVRVTNRKSGRSTIVTITDHGSFRAKHVIVDLSVGAAREIGLTEHAGLAPVTITPIGCSNGARIVAHRAGKRRTDTLSMQ